MRLSHDQMYDRLIAGDATYNGRFFTGVRTTGIYCLPSCKARKPKSENVDFFPSCEAARASGLRACRKCHPDDFARGADPVLQDIETLVKEIRAEPAHFPDVDAVVKRSGFGSTRLFELLRQHYHSTPADLILRSRLARARSRLAGENTKLADIAFESGFESLSVFHERFRQQHGLTPTAYRALASSARFSLELPPDYPLPHLRRSLGRDPESVSERIDGSRYRWLTHLEGEPALLSLDLRSRHVGVQWELCPDSGRKPEAPPARLGTAAHAMACGVLGLGQDGAGFSRLAARLGLQRLVAGREELRIAQTPTVFDGLLWSIIGQQINLPFAFRLRRRLIERVGRRVAEGWFVPPKPAEVAGLDPAELHRLQFSRPKASYVLGVSQRVASGELDLDRLVTLSASRVERTLIDVRGLGPWSVNYLMMRSLGFADCVPLGDTGVTSGLQTLFSLAERPDLDATRRLMHVFSPYRSLATAHLWQINQPNPS